MKKKTIHFNDQQLKDLDKLINILGIGGYGDIPKALAFSVTYTLQGLENDIKVLPTLNSDDFEKWISSVSRLYKQKRIKEIAKKMIKEAEK